MNQALILRHNLTKAPKQPGPQARETHSFLRLLVCGQAGRQVNGLEPYTRYLANLLTAQLNYFQDEIETNTSLKNLGEQARQSCDLVIFDEPVQSLFKSLFFAPPGCQAVKYIPTSVLIPRHPRWPLQRILLVTRGQESDDSAVEWAIRLARPSGAAVTVLAVQPAIT